MQLADLLHRFVNFSINVARVQQ